FGLSHHYENSQARPLRFERHGPARTPGAPALALRSRSVVISAGPFLGDAGAGATLPVLQRRPDEGADRLRLDEERVVAVERMDHRHLGPAGQEPGHLLLEIQ